MFPQIHQKTQRDTSFGFLALKGMAGPSKSTGRLCFMDSHSIHFYRMRTVPHSGTTYLFLITHKNHKHFILFFFTELLLSADAPLLRGNHDSTAQCSSHTAPTCASKTYNTHTFFGAFPSLRLPLYTVIVHLSLWMITHFNNLSKHEFSSLSKRRGESSTPWLSL